MHAVPTQCTRSAHAVQQLGPYSRVQDCEWGFGDLDNVSHTKYMEQLAFEVLALLAPQLVHILVESKMLLHA